MPKGTKKVEQETEVKVSEQQEVTPSGEGVKPLEVQPKAEIPEEVRALLAEAEEKAKKAEEEVTRKENVIQRLQKRKSEPVSPQPRDDGLFFARQYVEDRERKAKELGEFDPEIPRLRQELENREFQATQQQQWQQYQTFVADERDKLETVIVDAGENPKDEKFLDVWEKFDTAEKLTGNFTFAQKKAEQILKGIKPKESKEEPVKKKLEDLSPEEEEEIGMRYAKKKGWLKSDISTPSGGGGKLTAEQIDKMSPQERFERRKEIAEIPLGLGKE